MVVRPDPEPLLGAEDRLSTVAQNKRIITFPTDGENLEMPVIEQNLLDGSAATSQSMGAIGAEEREVKAGILRIMPGVIAGEHRGRQETPTFIGLAV
jgi:hypothetical protein